MTHQSYILSSGPIDPTTLESEVEANLQARLSKSTQLNVKEIEEISKYPFKLFPEGFELSELETSKMRALAALSQCQLKPAASITSHRKYIGRFIVFAKKLSWPLIRLHLKDTLAGIQGFQSWTVKSVAELIVATRK